MPHQKLLDEFFRTVPADLAFYRGAGCASCRFTGYSGRMILADLWVPDEADQMLITRRAAFDDVRKSATRTTFSMARDAHERLRAGRTTLEELLRVLPYDAVSEHREQFGVRQRMRTACKQALARPFAFGEWSGSWVTSSLMRRSPPSARGPRGSGANC